MENIGRVWNEQRVWEGNQMHSIGLEAKERGAKGAAYLPEYHI